MLYLLPMHLKCLCVFCWRKIPTIINICLPLSWKLKLALVSLVVLFQPKAPVCCSTPLVIELGGKKRKSKETKWKEKKHFQLSKITPVQQNKGHTSYRCAFDVLIPTSHRKTAWKLPKNKLKRTYDATYRSFVFDFVRFQSSNTRIPALKTL